MKFLNRVWLVMLFILSMLAASPSRAQTKTQTTEESAAASPEEDAQKKNFLVYVDLLRKDVFDLQIASSLPVVGQSS
jgi:hypothetical protein